ncbi:hypothetical protein QCA50_006345 [Cerrena zonata]|uniref:Protein kinase domain-containing protein n=1 Tax=Cerrena zonata TaxID=2478898 RepID=A0AAW0GMW4_9APHY
MLPRYYGPFSSPRKERRENAPTLSLSIHQTIDISLCSIPHPADEEIARGGLFAPTSANPHTTLTIVQYNLPPHLNSSYSAPLKRTNSQPTISSNTSFVRLNPVLQAVPYTQTAPVLPNWTSKTTAPHGRLHPLPAKDRQVDTPPTPNTIPDKDPDEKNENPQNCDDLRKILRKCREVCDLPPDYYASGVELTSTVYAYGGFSDVYKGRYLNRDVAVKQLRVRPDADGEKAKFRKKLFVEVILWKQCDYQYILPLIGVDFDPSSRPRLISPWMEKGSILKAAEALKHANKEYPAGEWLLQTAKALRFLSEKGMIHGDVRGANVLITNDLRIQLADFGLSSLINATNDSHGSYNGGATQWMAPELLTGDSRPTQASDIYSFACFSIEVYTLRNPYPSRNHNLVARRVISGHRPGRPSAHADMPMSDDLWHLMNLCWNADPSERPSAPALVNHLTRMGL